MDQNDLNKFHKILHDHCEKNGFGVVEILALLSSFFVGTMAINGYTDVQVDILLLKLKEEFVNHPRRKKK